MLVSDVQHSLLGFFCLFLRIIFHYRFLQDCGFNSPCYTVNPCCLPIFCIVCNKFTVIKGKGEVRKEQIRSMGYKLTVLSELGFRSQADQGILSSGFVFLYFSSRAHCHSDLCHFLCQWQGVLWMDCRPGWLLTLPLSLFLSLGPNLLQVGASGPFLWLSALRSTLFPSSPLSLLVLAATGTGKVADCFCIMSFDCNNLPSHKNSSYLNFPTVRALAKWDLISPDDLKTWCLLTILLKMLRKRLRKGDILISQ